MYLFTVIVPLAAQAALAYVVPTGLPTHYACDRGISHDASLAPAVGVHNRDLDPCVAETTVGHHIPMMPPFGQQYATTIVTHTITKTEPLKDSSDSTTTITVTKTRTTTVLIKGNATGPANITNTKNASLNGTVPHNTRPKHLKVSTDSKCGTKVERTCIGHKDGHWCSRYGYCGDTDAHCGAGCQSEFGVCGLKGLVDENSTVK